MKKATRISALLLSAIIMISLLAACGGGGHKVFTVDEVYSSSPDQQRWLKYPGSDLIINPDALTDKDNFSDDENKMSALDLGILDADGNVKYVIDDAMFFLESSAANGIGGEEVWVGAFTDDADGASKYKGIGKLTPNNSTGYELRASTSADAVTLTAGYKQPLGDFSVPYYCVINVVDCTGTIQCNYAATKPSASANALTINSPGVYIIDLTQLVKDITTDTTDRTVGINLVLSANGTFNISRIAIKTIPKALSKATKAAATSWTPFSITTDTAYPNGTGIKVIDTIMTGAVARQLTCTANGLVYVGGKIHGETVYDKDNNRIQVTGDGYKYLIDTKRKGAITFFDNEADMQAMTNGSDTQTASSQYWVLVLPSVTVDGTDYAMAIAASATKSFDEMVEYTDASTSNTKVKRHLNEAVEWFNAYIAAYDVSGYIENLPE